MPNLSLSQTKARQQQRKTILLTTLGVIGGLLACFGFGFFVIARFINSSPSDKANVQAKNSNPLVTDTNLPPSNNTPSPAPQKEDNASKLGPVLEAVEKKKPVTSPSDENTSGTSPSKSGGENEQDGETERKGSRRVRRDADNNEETVQEPSSLEAEPKKERKSRERRRRDRATEVDRTNTDEPSNSDESTETRANRDEQTRTPSVETDEKPKLHRVQVGVYSTRESAEGALGALQGQGVQATVRRVKRNGRSYYSLQSGAYKRKESAEAAREKLKEVGQDAYITEE